MQHHLEVRKTDGSNEPIVFESGTSVVIVGANGAGKTRLAVHLERTLIVNAHRISAQKDLGFSDDVSLISLERAENKLRFGRENVELPHKEQIRWKNKPATTLLEDFDALQQHLFADHNRHASQYLQAVKVDPQKQLAPPTTKLEALKALWDELLPHRKLQLFEASIKVAAPGNPTPYAASEMSDGERAMFYFIGQTLAAPSHCVLIVDEPEGHVHKAIVAAMWDALEGARPDCTFVYLTHDLDFAASRKASAKYFVRSYVPSPEAWDIEKIPEDTGLPEQVVAELVGSRKPVLFIEGERGSIDETLYRLNYTKFTIMPIGSCSVVIQAVASYNQSPTLHWMSARGLVDADARDANEIAALAARNVHVLPVAEVENLLLLPDVFRALAEALQCDTPTAKLIALEKRVMAEATTHLDEVTARYTTRQLDRHLKNVTIKAKDLATLQTAYSAEIANIDPTALFAAFRRQLEQAINANDLPEVLKLYDNKGLLAQAATILGIAGPKHLMEKVSRLLGSKDGQKLRDALSSALPVISP